jgi:hypothetical protein
MRPKKVSESTSDVLTPLGPISKLRATKHAGIAQLVEHHLAKVGVAGSSPVSRSLQREATRTRRASLRIGAVAKW